MTRRTGMRVLVFGALVVTVGAAAAVVLSAPRVTRVARPPQQLAAAPRTATVTKEVIRQRYTFSGSLSAAVQPRPLRSEGVVTGVPVRQGQVAHAGQVLLEINGRPVIGLNLPFPLWRDLTADVEGKDVTVVQGALGEVGVYAGPISGVYDGATQAAVRTLYLRLGYSPPSQGSADPSSQGSADPSIQGSGDTSGGSDSEGSGAAGGADAGAGDDDSQASGGDASAGKASRSNADRDHTVLPAAEVAPLGGGPWRMNLSGVTVGSVLAGEDPPSLNGAGTRLTVEDNGQLAQLLADGSPRHISLVVGDESTRIRATVVSSRADGNESRVLVRSASGRLSRGTVAGSAIMRSTSKPVTSVPVTALRPTADGRTLVRAVIDGRAQDIPVMVGLRGDRLVEVHGRRLVPGLTVELI